MLEVREKLPQGLKKVTGHRLDAIGGPGLVLFLNTTQTGVKSASAVSGKRRFPRRTGQHTQMLGRLEGTTRRQPSIRKRPRYQALASCTGPLMGLSQGNNP
jgi:hypothetical protein